MIVTIPWAEGVIRQAETLRQLTRQRVYVWAVPSGNLPSFHITLSPDRPEWDLFYVVL
jgi:hypothetical protein